MSEQRSFTDLDWERQEAELRDKIEVHGGIITIKLDTGELTIRHMGNYATINVHFSAGSAAILHRDLENIEIRRYGIGRDNQPEFF